MPICPIGTHRRAGKDLQCKSSPSPRGANWNAKLTSEVVCRNSRLSSINRFRPLSLSSCRAAMSAAAESNSFYKEKNKSKTERVSVIHYRKKKGGGEKTQPRLTDRTKSSLKPLRGKRKEEKALFYGQNSPHTTPNEPDEPDDPNEPNNF